MAQGNLILGTMKGKLGDIVAYNYNGKQAARVRRRQVSNPKSSKQAIQRAIAATVAKFVSAFAPVLNNSLQNEGSKVSTLAKIRSLNMTKLRQLAAENEGTYTPKGTMFIAPNNYIISRGSLAGMAPLSSEAAIDYMKTHCGAAFSFNSIAADDLENTASDAFPTIAVGDQITILCSTTEDVQEGSITAYCRFAFKDDVTPVFISDQDVTRLNPEAIDLTKADGPWAQLSFTDIALSDDARFLFVDCSEILSGVAHIDNFGLIVSREDGKLRSNATMVSVGNAEYSLADVYPTYMAGGSPINMPSELYLNNDANAEG